MNRFEYVIHKRPNYEVLSATSWFASAGAYTTYSALHFEPTVVLAGSPIFAGMAFYRAYQAYIQHGKNVEFKAEDNVEVINFKGLEKKFRPDALWLGKGFAWTPDQAQRFYDEFLRNPAAMQNLDVSDPNTPDGAFWLHSLGDGEKDIYRKIKNFDSHTLIAGTTGAGKTKNIIIILAQLLMRKNEPIIIIDPKNDDDLRDSVQRICEHFGRHFLHFNPAFPEKSCRIDILHNWSRVTQIADRIKAILPQGGDADVFANIIWNVINAIASCMVLKGESPSIVSFRRYMSVENMDKLIIDAIKAHAENVEPNWKTYYATYQGKEYTTSKNNPMTHELLTATYFYKEVVAPKKPNTDIEELINVRTHNREHLQKLIASLFPVLSMLSSGGLDELLSPTPNPNDPREIVNTQDMVDNRSVLWLGLDTLSDQTIGGMIGSAIISDLTSVAGGRYNFEKGGDFNVNLVVDEAAEVINAPMIQMLNKSRGAGFRNFLLTQTLADFNVRLESEDRARQVLGNINNEIVLRTKDAKTAEYFAESLPEVMVKKMGTQYQTNVGHNPISEFGGRYGESMEEELLPIVPSWAYRVLPDFHYFGSFAGGGLIKGRLPILDTKELER